MSPTGELCQAYIPFIRNWLVNQTDVPCLLPGQIVVFSISPERTATHFEHHRSDLSKLRSLKSGKYLGIISSSYVMPSTTSFTRPFWRRFFSSRTPASRHEISINLIGLVPPDDSLLKESDGCNPRYLSRALSGMCVAIGNQPVFGSPGGDREPLRPNRKIPWKDALVYTTIKIRGVVGKIHCAERCVESAAYRGWYLPDAELHRLDSYIFADVNELDDSFVQAWDNNGDFRDGYFYVDSIDQTMAPERLNQFGTLTAEICPEYLELDIWLDIACATDQIGDPQSLRREWNQVNEAVAGCYWDRSRSLDQSQSLLHRFGENVITKVNANIPKGVLRWITLEGSFRNEAWPLGFGLACGLGLGIAGNLAFRALWTP